MAAYLIKLIRHHPEIQWKVRLIGLFVMLLGLWCLSGHLVGNPWMYEMGFQLGMGFPTAVGFVATGNALMLISWAENGGTQTDH